MNNNINNNNNKKNDVKIIIWIVVAFIFVAWLCTPPGNKFLQICFWGNNTKFFVAKMTGKYDTSYIFYRNNAIYLAKMFPERKDALREMDKAIKAVPNYISEDELGTLYKERAEIKLFLGETKNVLSDYINSNQIGFNDNIRVAILYKDAGNYREAMSYCNAILSKDVTAYAGYVCMSEIYLSLDRPDVALKVWDLAIDRKKNNARAYSDRAKVKRMLGDLSGYESDVQLAKKYLPTIDLDASYVQEVMHPKILTLSIRKS